MFSRLMALGNDRPALRARGRRVSTVALAAGLLATACGASETVSAAGPVATAAPAVASNRGAAPSQAETRPALQNLERSTLTGEILDVSQFDGKDVLVWFWAPW